MADTPQRSHGIDQVGLSSSNDIRLSVALPSRSAASPDLRKLSSPDLAQRLQALAGEEREVQAAFLIHVEEFDRRRGYLEAGYGSLWDWCLRVLHLREGAAGRRIGAMKVVRRFPRIAEAVRDGRLCLSTVGLLGPVLTEDNFDDVVARAAYKTKADVDYLVASLRPRESPKDGIRQLPSSRLSVHSAAVIAPRPSGPLPASMSNTVGFLRSRASPGGNHDGTRPDRTRRRCA